MMIKIPTRIFKQKAGMYFIDLKLLSYFHHTYNQYVLYYILILDKETAIKLFRQVEDACILLSEYNFRLNAELEERKQVGKMLRDFLTCQKDQVVKGEEKLQVQML